MKTDWISITIRFVILVVLQVVVFKRIQFDFSILSYAQLFIYPLWIAIFPVKIPKPILLISAFVLGLLIDGFYDSPGVHAGSLVLIAFCRDFILSILEPEKGYNMDKFFDLKRLGIIWLFSYLGLFMFIHLLSYFALEAFSFVYIYEIMISTVVSLFFSILVMFIYLLIDNPSR